MVFCVFVLSLILSPALAAQSGPSMDREREQMNNEALWRQALGGAITGYPTVQVQSVVMTLDGGNIKAYSSSGTALWNYSARGRLSPFVTRSREGTSYISRTNGVLIAVNRSGRELWRRNPGGPLSGAVVTGWDGRVFVPTGKKISCYTAAGGLLWSREFDSNIALSPLLDQRGSIVLSLENRELLRIDPFGGLSTRSLEKAPKSVASFEDGSFLILYESGAPEILDFSDSDTKPLPQLPAPPLAAIGRENMAAVCLVDGRTVLLSKDGGVLWTGESHIGVKRRSSGQSDTEAAMIFDERGIYVLSVSGATGFAGDGRRLWFTLIENAAAIPAFGDDGVLYSGGRDWILYAYQLENRIKQEKQSLYGPAPQGDYGLGNPPPSSWSDDYFRFEEPRLRARLGLIASSIKSGKVGENEVDWTACLMETASGEYNRTAVLAPLQYRVQALQLLGQIASREIIPYLVTIFNKDRESLVRAAAAGAIGAIGLDPDGIALQAFMGAISPAAQAKDERLLVSVASATGALCRFSGPPLSDTGVKILTVLTASSQPRMAQQRAHRELAALAQKP
jgi:outer membrane protein assembly factor BamB